MADASHGKAARWRIWLITAAAITCGLLLLRLVSSDATDEEPASPVIALSAAHYDRDAPSLESRLRHNAVQLGRALVDARVRYKQQNFTVLGHSLAVHEGTRSHTSDYVAREINHGDYRLAELAALPSPGLVRAGDVLLDLGTNVALTAVLLARMFPQARVLGVEPAPYNYAAAVANVQANGVEDRVTVIHAALAPDARELVHIVYGLSNPGGASGAPLKGREKDDAVAGKYESDIAAVTLAELLQLGGVDLARDCVPFIKLDCEGCEYLLADSIRDTPQLRSLFESAFVVGETHAHSWPGLDPALKSFVDSLFDVTQFTPPVLRDGKASARHNTPSSDGDSGLDFSTVLQRVEAARTLLLPRSRVIDGRRDSAGALRAV